MFVRFSGLAAAVILAGAVLWTAPVSFAEDPPPKAATDAAAEQRRQEEIAKMRAAIPQGPVTVEYKDGLVTLKAEKAWKVKILTEIGKLAGFKIVGGKASQEPVTMSLTKTPLEEAIRKVAAGEPYWINYENDGATSKYAIKTVLIGPNSLRAAMTMARRDKFRAAREARLREKQGVDAPPAAPRDDFSSLLPKTKKDGEK